MELNNRPNFRTNTSINSSITSTSELFICFTATSSMKLTKSSIFSPCRAAARDGGGPASLSSSLSRRLRSNGSIKRCHSSSPFFTSTKKKGNGFENPEPTSPKVTCIGQVRVKTKKKLKKRRSLSSKRQQNEEKSFPHQRWVHLPVSICDALRTFGSEFSCLFPCKSSCFSTTEKIRKSENGFGKWLVSVNDGENEERREIDFFYEEEEEKRSSRRHVFEDIEVKDDRIEVKGQSFLEVEPRMSISIPPKNALLLMRCRSDPIKMANLANKFSWNGHENGNNIVEDENEDFGGGCESKDETFTSIVKNDEVGSVSEQDFVVSVGRNEEHEITVEVEATFEKIQEDELVICSEEMEIEVKEEQASTTPKEEEDKEEVESNMSSFEDLLDQELNADVKHCPIQENEESPICHLSSSTTTESEDNEEENQLKPKTEGTHQECAEKTPQVKNQELVIMNDEETKKLTNKESPLLPDCLMLMMCSEPKLSMEVSKETWVCTTDFVRRQKPPKSKPNENIKIKIEPPRSSCSLVKAMTYEPFVLSRCNSEPMRTAVAKLVPAESSCLWNNNKAILKMEQHRVRVGAAGVGF